MTEKKSALVLVASGFMHCRLIAVDESDGSMRRVAGVLFRIRPSHIFSYLADEPGVVLLWCIGLTEPVAISGTVEEVDTIMLRANITVVEEA